MTMTSGTARIDDRGRVVLPAEVRRRLEMHPGDELVVTEEAGGALRLQSRRAAARALIGLAGPLTHSAVADLRADRRRDAAADADTVS
jgi:AbrB family looped-hinge helix DNA binding protein